MSIDYKNPEIHNSSMEEIERITSELKALGLTWAALSRHLGVADQTTYNWRARNSVPKEHLAKTAEFLGVTVDWILTGDEPKHPLRWDEDVSVDDIAKYLNDPDIRRLILRYASATEYGRQSVRVSLDLDESMRGEDHSPVSDEAIGPAGEDI